MRLLQTSVAVGSLVIVDCGLFVSASSAWSFFQTYNILPNLWEDEMSKHRWSPEASRRNFLKGAGLVGAAAAVTPSVAANATPAVQSEKLRAAASRPPADRRRVDAAVE